MVIGTGLLALLALVILWLLGHLLIGIIVAVVILCFGGGGIYLGGSRNKNRVK